MKHIQTESISICTQCLAQRHRNDMMLTFAGRYSMKQLHNWHQQSTQYFFPICEHGMGFLLRKKWQGTLVNEQSHIYFFLRDGFENFCYCCILSFAIRHMFETEKTGTTARRDEMRKEIKWKKSIQNFRFEMKKGSIYWVAAGKMSKMAQQIRAKHCMQQYELKLLCFRSTENRN